MPRAPVLLILAAVALTVGGTIAAVAATGVRIPPHISSRPDVYFAGPAPRPEAPTPGVDPELLERYEVFRRPRGTEDELPSTVAVRGQSVPALSPTDREVGANPALARRATTTADGDEVYLVPAEGGFCFASTKSLEGGCIPTRRALNGKTAASIICSPFLAPELVEVYGTLPDDVTGATISFEDGSSKRLVIEGNVYIVRTPRTGPLPTSIEWSDSDGPHQIATPVPRSAREPCSAPARPVPGKASQAPPEPSGSPPDLRPPAAGLDVPDR